MNGSLCSITIGTLVDYMEMLCGSRTNLCHSKGALHPKNINSDELDEHLMLSCDVLVSGTKKYNFWKSCFQSLCTFLLYIELVVIAAMGTSCSIATVRIVVMLHPLLGRRPLVKISNIHSP